MHYREVYKRVFTPIAEQRIREQACPNCGLPKSEWKRRTDWRCCSKECTGNFWKDHVEILDWSVIRSMVFKRDNYVCAICHKRFVISESEDFLMGDTAKLVGDHIVPIAVGGSEFDMDNVQTLCIDCNKIKTAQDMKVIAKYRRKEKILEKNQTLNIGAL